METSSKERDNTIQRKELAAIFTILQTYLAYKHLRLSLAVPLS